MPPPNDPTKPATTPDPLESAAKDALRAAIGKAPSRIARGIVSGLAAIAANRGLGWINPNDPTTGLLIAFGSAALVNGAMAYARDKWGARTDWLGSIVRWLPI